MSYPLIQLEALVEVQAPVNISEIEVLHVAENLQDKTVQAFVNYGVNTAWVPILNESNYIPNWSDSDISAAIRSWATNTFPLAK